VTDDESQICADSAIINGLGTIVLEVKRIEENGPELRRAPRPPTPFEPSITDNTFHESKSKLLGNCVGLGDAQFVPPADPYRPRAPMPKWDVIEEDRGKLWLRFVFHYRAGHVLEMLGFKEPSQHTPAPPAAYSPVKPAATNQFDGGWSPEGSPEPQQQERTASIATNGDVQYLATAQKQLPGEAIVIPDSDDEDDDAETLALKARIDAVKEENARLRERASSAVVKRERMDSAPADLPSAKRGRAEDGGEIDLTLEDDE